MQEIELLFKIAQLYYEQNLTQEEIAKRLYVSRSNISRLLSQAREQGIVEISVHYPFERKRKIESAFNRYFDLDEIRVVDANNRTGSDLYTATTKLAASYINLQLNNNAILALTCGNSICGMVHEMHPRTYLPGMQVVTTMGSIESSNMVLDGHYLARQVAEIYGCTYHALMVPFRVDDPEMQKNLCKRPAVQATLGLAERANILCTGITTKAQNGYLAGMESDCFNQGAVGAIAGYYFDKDGQILDFQNIYDCFVCANKNIFKIPIRCAIVADERKAEATLAALRGKLINALVTNTLVANRILELNGCSADEYSSFPVQKG